MRSFTPIFAIDTKLGYLNEIGAKLTSKGQYNLPTLSSSMGIPGNIINLKIN